MKLIIISVLSAWLLSQALKIFISKRTKAFFETGGMPSSHSAFVSALCTAAGLTEGFSSTLFLVSAGFSAIIIHDAIHIRKHHKPKEVFAGIILGIIITLIIRAAFL